MKFFAVSIFVFLFYSLAGAQSSAEVLLNGRVVDASTKESIAFANIRIKDSQKGCSSDINGVFDIAIPSNYDSVFIEASCIGYKKLNVWINKRRPQPKIFLTPETYELGEVVVVSRTSSIESVIIRAVESIPTNYYCSDFSFDIFCKRELYDFKYNYPVVNQQVVAEGFYEKGYKERKVAHRGSNINFNIVAQKTDGQKNEYTNFEYGLFTGYGLIIIDIVRHSNSPLDKKNIKDFFFRLDSVSPQRTDTIYHISFSDKNTNYGNSAVMGAKKYSGSISVSLPSYTVIRYEGAVLLDKDSRFTSQRGFSDNPMLSFVIEYGNIGGKYVFSYAKSSMLIYDEGKKLRFNQEFIPYKFNFSKPKKVLKDNVSIDINKNTEDSFWNSYRKPSFIER